jgi:hypothetical protein
MPSDFVGGVGLEPRTHRLRLLVVCRTSFLKRHSLNYARKAQIETLSKRKRQSAEELVRLLL